MTDLSKELLTRADLIFGKIADAASNVNTLAMEQLPDIATQFILYSRVLHTAQLFGALILIGLAVWLYKMGFKKRDNKQSFYDYEGFWYFRLGTLCAIIGLFLLILKFHSFCMVWLAPKIFLITEIVQLVKG